jgi:glycosyltransferase involved in cell wall biosynthesis
VFDVLDVVLSDIDETDRATMGYVGLLLSRYDNVRIGSFADAVGEFVTFVNPRGEAINDGYGELLRYAEDNHSDVVFGDTILMSRTEHRTNDYCNQNKSNKANPFLSSVIVRRSCIKNINNSWYLDDLDFENADKVAAIDLPISVYYANIHELEPWEGIENPSKPNFVSQKSNFIAPKPRLSAKATDTTDAKSALVLCTRYPSNEDIYANMFIHSRVKAYRKQGFSPEVFSCAGTESVERTFDGTTVHQGSAGKLTEYLKRNPHIKQLLCHLMRPDMWQAVKPFLNRLKLLVWVHGAEAQPWWRREYNYTTDEELAKAKKSSEQRMKCFREMFEFARKNPDKLHFVFVSQHFAEEIAEDYGVKLDNVKHSIIHNGVDADLFNYVPKNAEQRKLILSVRPWTNRKYGNDIAVRSVIELSKYKEFADMRFLFVGQGTLWDELTEPLRKFSNVTLRNEFLTHKQIAELHKQYGVFLVPTRMDSQGVSRDEAMSSGLVPITNSVAAIPEFCTDGEDSLPVASEDWKGMAEALLKLYREPELFMRLSKNAAARVRNQSAETVTTRLEMEVIAGNAGGK